MFEYTNLYTKYVYGMPLISSDNFFGTAYFEKHVIHIALLDD